MVFMKKMLILFEEMAVGHCYGPPNVAHNVIDSLFGGCMDLSVKPIPAFGYTGKYSSIKEFFYQITHNTRKVIEICSVFLTADVINLHYVTSLNRIICVISARLFRKPLILNVYFAPGSSVFAFIKYAPFIIAMNQDVYNHLIDKGVSEERVSMIPPPINCDKFRKGDRIGLRMKYGIPLDKFVLLYHGRPVISRGIALFLQVAKHICELQNNVAVLLSIADIDTSISKKVSWRQFIVNC